MDPITATKISIRTMQDLPLLARGVVVLLEADGGEGVRAGDASSSKVGMAMVEARMLAALEEPACSIETSSSE
jgi:hypothetical protein